MHDNDSCTKRNGQPATEACPVDRLAYEGIGGVYLHATIANNASYDGPVCKPREMIWKCSYSGVYRWDNSTHPDRFDTPGCKNITQNTGSPPTGEWIADFWDSTDADVYYD